MGKLSSFGYAALGLGFLVNAYKEWGNPGEVKFEGAGPQRRRGGLAGATAKRRTTRDPGANMQSDVVDVKTIDQRVEQMRQLLCKGGMDPKVHEMASEIVSQKCSTISGKKTWCVPEKNSLAETAAIYKAIRDPNSKYAIRYTSDMAFADTFTEGKRTLMQKHSGDCDDYSLAIGSLLLAIGHPVTIRVIRTTNKSTWNHVYLMTPQDHQKPDGPWVAVDGSMDRPFGWQAPGADTCAATGRPAGIVAEVKDYLVAC